MSRLCLFIFSIIFFFGSSLAQVPKSGDIDGETWTAEDSLYLITGDIKIINLTIESGVIVQFEDNYKFDVDGILRADGFHSDSIYFQPHPDNNTGWQGIKFKKSSTSSSLKYCRIEGSNKDGVNIDQVQPEISNCRIGAGSGRGILVKGTNIQLQHCIISNNSLSGIEINDAQVTLVNLIIANNGGSGILSTNNNDVINLINAVIVDNQDRGIDCPGGDLTVRNSIIYENGIQIDSQDGLINVTYSDIQGLTVYPGLGNINANPEFLERRFYTLSQISECIDAGDPNFSYSDLFFPPSLGTSLNDIGAYGGPQAYGWYPPLYIKPQRIDFQRVTQDSSHSTTLNILNYRNTGIIVSETSFEEDDDEVFSHNLDTFSVGIMDSIEMAVTFTPESEREYTSDLIFKTQSHGTVSIPVSAEGVLPHIDMPSSKLNFGAVQLRENWRLELPILNLGGDTLFVEVVSPLLSNFTIDKSQFTIDPDSASETITVTFSPDSPIIYEDSLLILSNDRERPEIKVSLTGLGLGPVIELDQQILDFDSVAVLSDSVLILNIRNNGNDTLLINNLSIQPLNSGFVFDETPITLPLLVEPGSNKNLSILFYPSERGPLSAQLSIYSNDPFQSMLTVNLSGTGIAPLMLLSSSEIQFGSVPLTTDSTINLTVFNLGNYLLYLDSLFIDPSKDIFKMTDTTISFPYILETETNFTFPIRFKPVERGIKNAQITLISNDPFQDTVLINLSGEGVAPGLNLSTYTLSFGTVPLDSESVKNLIIYNTIETGLNVNSIVVDSWNSVFSFADTTVVFPQVIQGKDSLILPIRFRPTQPDTVSADLRIFSDDPFQKEVKVQLSGRGIDTSPKPYIDLSSTFLEFNEVDTNYYSQKNLYIYNTGNADLIIPEDSIYISESFQNTFLIMNLSGDLSIDPDDSLDILIRFQPSEIGPVQDTLVIKSNDPTYPTKKVLLSGTGIGIVAPVISYNPTYSTNPLINRQPAILSFEISGSIPIDSAVIFVRQGGKTSFTAFSLENQGTTGIWSADIDSDFITERGLEYYVRVNQNHTISFYPKNGVNHPIALSVQIPYLVFPDAIPAETYQMISIPFNTTGQTLSDLFVDNLGPYNDRKYRFFECKNGTDYSEIKEMDKPLPPGKSVWLIMKESIKLDIQNGESVITDQNFMLELKQGWNMIATPFTFPVIWSHLEEGLALRHYDGSDWPFMTVMEPFKGYAVKSSKDTLIALSANEASISKSVSKYFEPDLEDNWNIQIIASSDHARDQFNYVGVLKSATSGNDLYDFPEPPTIGDHLSLFLVSLENNEHLSTDFRQPDNDGYIFEIELCSDVTGQKIIEVHPNNLPEKYDWIIISLESNLNLGQKPIKTSLNNEKYKLIVGTIDFINKNTSDFKSVPIDFKLSQNYPNPFNPSTIINYELPIPNYVELIIYNLLGQEVETLVSEKIEAGYHQIEWDASGFASGVYYYRLHAGGFQDIKKMILTK